MRIPKDRAPTSPGEMLLEEFLKPLGFLVGEPDGRWLFWLHRVGGLALVVLLLWKAGVAASSYRRRGATIGTGLSTVFGSLFLGSLATGVLWATVGLTWVPVLGRWTVLGLHVALSLVLIPLFVVHLGLRWPRPGRADLLGRRAQPRVSLHHRLLSPVSAGGGRGSPAGHPR